jgi:hypothetical protein
MVFHSGVKFAPRGELVEEWRGEQRISHPGDNFTPRGLNSPLWDNFAPVGQLRSCELRPCGSKFATRGEVKNGPQGCGSFRPKVSKCKCLCDIAVRRINV